uniref:Uncharacterized protein n=1 Tax=Oryza barthii TaxID=65489 RepID=A0A0D3HTW0_9ORYZ
MVEAMELNYPDEAVNDVAMPMDADIAEKRPNSVTDAKIEKLARFMQILVFTNCSALVFVLVCSDMRQHKNDRFRFGSKQQATNSDTG